MRSLQSLCLNDPSTALREICGIRDRSGRSGSMNVKLSERFCRGALGTHSSFLQFITIACFKQTCVTQKKKKKRARFVFNFASLRERWTVIIGLALCFFPFLHERRDGSICCLARIKEIFSSSPHLASSAVFMFIILNWHSVSTVGRLYFCPVRSSQPACLSVCLEQLSPQKARGAAAMFLITYSP